MPIKEYVIYYTTLEDPDKEYCAVFKTLNTSLMLLEEEFRRYLSNIDEEVDRITNVIPVDKETAVILFSGWQLHKK